MAPSGFPHSLGLKFFHQKLPEQRETASLEKIFYLSKETESVLELFQKSPAFMRYWEGLSDHERTDLLEIAELYEKFFQEDFVFVKENAPEFFRRRWLLMAKVVEITRIIKAASPQDFFLGFWIIFSLQYSAMRGGLFFDAIRRELIEKSESFKNQELSGKMQLWFGFRHFLKGRFYGEISPESWRSFIEQPLCSNAFLQVIAVIEMFQEAFRGKLSEHMFDVYSEICRDDVRDRKLCLAVAAHENPQTPPKVVNSIRERTLYRSDEMEKWFEEFHKQQVQSGQHVTGRLDGFLERVDLLGAHKVFPLMWPKEIALFLAFCMRQYRHRQIKFHLKLSPRAISHLRKDLNQGGSFLEIEKLVLEKYFRIEKDERIWEEKEELLQEPR